MPQNKKPLSFTKWFKITYIKRLTTRVKLCPGSKIFHILRIKQLSFLKLGKRFFRALSTIRDEVLVRRKIELEWLFGGFLQAAIFSLNHLYNMRFLVSFI